MVPDPRAKALIPAHQIEDMSADSQITLYRLQGCPFCERVVDRLDEYGLEYESRFVEPMHSARNVVKRVSGSRTVPAIIDDETGVTMSESGNIVEYLDDTYGDASAEEPATSAASGDD